MPMASHTQHPPTFKLSHMYRRSICRANQNTSTCRGAQPLYIQQTHHHYHRWSRDLRRRDPTHKSLCFLDLKQLAPVTDPQPPPHQNSTSTSNRVAPYYQHQHHQLRNPSLHSSQTRQAHHPTTSPSPTPPPNLSASPNTVPSLPHRPH